MSDCIILFLIDYPKHDLVYMQFRQMKADVSVNDVLMGTPNSDLSGMVMAVLHTAGQWILAVAFDLIENATSRL